MLKGEGVKVARLLARDGWNVEVNKDRVSYTASHPEATTTLWWKARACNPQRLRDQANAALGVTVGTPSGRNRKAKQAREREVVRVEQAAHAKALQITKARTQDRLTKHNDGDKAVTGASYHAIMRGEERGITGDMVYDTLTQPTGIYPDRRGRTKYVGEHCIVIVSDTGVIVTIY